MARMPIPARGSRRVLFASIGLVASALFGAGALAACGAPAVPQPGPVVPAVVTSAPTIVSVQPLGVSTVIATPVAVITTAIPTHAATTHAVTRRPTVTFVEPRVSLPVHRATHTPTRTVLPTTRAASSCFGDYYLDSSGVCVHRPATAAGPPVGATAQCQDGVYSFSQHHRGTCSGHGGVARWL